MELAQKLQLRKSPGNEMLQTVPELIIFIFNCSLVLLLNAVLEA